MLQGATLLKGIMLIGSSLVTVEDMLREGNIAVMRRTERLRQLAACDEAS